MSKVLYKYWNITLISVIFTVPVLRLVLHLTSLLNANVEVVPVLATKL